MWLSDNDVTTSWDRGPNGTFQMRFTCVQIWCFWHLRYWRYVHFQTGHDDFEQIGIDSHFAVFGLVKIDPVKIELFIFTDFGQVTVILQLLYWVWARRLIMKNNPNPLRLTKNPRTTQFLSSTSYFQWLNQPESRTGFPRFQRFSLLFLSVTRFSNLCDRIKYAW